MPRASLSRLARVYLRAGNLTFGGGDPTVAALYSELVSARAWLPPDKYALVYALARVTPGTNVLAFCAGSAWAIAGWRGAVAAVTAATLPSAVVAVLLTAGYEAVRANTVALAAINGTLAAAVGMMASGAWLLAQPHFARGFRLRAALLVAGSFLLAFRFAVSPVAVLALAAAAGWLWRAPEAS